MATTTQIVGSARLRRALKKAGHDVNDLKRAHLAAANVVANAARVTAPVRKPRERKGIPRPNRKKRGRPPVPGKLKASVRAGATQRAAIIRAGNARAPYAGPIHWGWPKRNIKQNTWILDAARATENQWLIPYRAEVAKAMRKVGGY